MNELAVLMSIPLLIGLALVGRFRENRFKEGMNVFTDCFRLSPAVNVLGTLVPIADRPIGNINFNDGIIGQVKKICLTNQGALCAAVLFPKGYDETRKEQKARDAKKIVS